MKLAEALALRAEATRRIEQLRGRIIDNARYQDGEEPAEDAASLLAQTGEACAELESLIRRINRTNAVARLGAGTITDAIARRDMLKLRHSVITAAADAAAGRGRGWSRHAAPPGTGHRYSAHQLGGRPSGRINNGRSR
jgi:hypothetical protein